MLLTLVAVSVSVLLTKSVEGSVCEEVAGTGAVFNASEFFGEKGWVSIDTIWMNFRTSTPYQPMCTHDTASFIGNRFLTFIYNYPDGSQSAQAFEATDDPNLFSSIDLDEVMWIYDTDNANYITYASCAESDNFYTSFLSQGVVPYAATESYQTLVNDSGNTLAMEMFQTIDQEFYFCVDGNRGSTK